jgi:hypothetical protein
MSFICSPVAPSGVASSALASSALACPDASKPSISYGIIEFTRAWIMQTVSDPLSQKLLLKAAFDPFACLDMISELINEERQQHIQMQDQGQFQGQVEFQQMQNDITIVSSVKEPVLVASNTIAPLDIKSLKKDESSIEEKSSDNSSRKEEKSSSNENKDDKTSWAAVASVVTTTPQSAQPAPSPSGSSSLSSVKSNKSAKSVTSAASSSNSGNSNTYINTFVDTVIDDEVEEGNINGVDTEQKGGYHVINDINMFMKSVLQNTDITIDTIYLYLTIINMPNESGRGLFFANTTMFKETILPAFQANEIKVHGFNKEHEFYTNIKQYIDRILVEKNGVFRRKINAKLYITSKFLTMCTKHFY